MCIIHKIEAAIKNMWEQNSESSLFDNPMDEIRSVYKEGEYSKLAEFLDRYNPNPHDEPQLQRISFRHTLPSM
ncbi:MAG: hypothetical protein KAH86_08575 [Methanosarcinales archaeon]|nr:hypothetical protein [Methanosarcinales archaeon]